MALSNNYRKLFVDSRWRSSGGHNDFTIELPNDVDTTRTSSVYLASCSFSNTFETVLSGVNDRLYYISKDTAHVPSVVSSNNKLYALAKSGTAWVWIPPSARLAYFVQITGASVTPSNNKLYFMYQNPLQSNSFVLYAKTVALGAYTATQLAAQIQSALLPTIPGLSVAWNGSSYVFNFPNANWWVPTHQELPSHIHLLTSRRIERSTTWDVASIRQTHKQTNSKETDNRKTQ